MVTPTADGKQLEFCEDRGSKIFKADTRSIKNKNLKDMVVQEHVSDDHVAVDTTMEEPNNNLTTTEDSSEPLYPDMTKHGVSVGDVVAEEKASHKTPTLVEMSSKTDDAVTSSLKQNYVGNASVKEKVWITDTAKIKDWHMKSLFCDYHMCQLGMLCFCPFYF